MYEYRARITKVTDGDTVHAALDLGCDVTTNLTLRLVGINAPEMNTDEGKAAKAWLTARLSAAQFRTGSLLVRTVKDRKEKYGRYLADLVDLDFQDTSINAEMVAAGHAVPYYP